MLGHIDFVEEILARKATLARELDSRRCSALHLATGNGCLNIVKKLLSVCPEMCLVRDQDGRTPLHVATMKGNISLVRELFHTRPQAARILKDRRQSILHACVAYSQVEAFEFLLERMEDDVDEGFVNWKDDDGNTVLHVAVADKQEEAIKILLSSSKTDLNDVNAIGCSVLDVALQSKSHVKDWRIRDMLLSVGALRARNEQPASVNSMMRKASGFLIRKTIWLSEQRNSLMVGSTMFLTLACQINTSPPGGVWQDTVGYDDVENIGPTRGHFARFAVMMDRSPDSFNELMIANSITFGASFGVILLLLSGLPFKHRFYYWVLIGVMIVSANAVYWSFLVSLSLVTNTGLGYPPVGGLLLWWMFLMAILSVGHLIHAVRSCWKFFKHRRTATRTIMV